MGDLIRLKYKENPYINKTVGILEASLPKNSFICTEVYATLCLFKFYEANQYDAVIAKMNERFGKAFEILPNGFIIAKTNAFNEDIVALTEYCDQQIILNDFRNDVADDTIFFIEMENRGKIYGYENRKDEFYFMNTICFMRFAQEGNKTFEIDMGVTQRFTFKEGSAVPNRLAYPDMMIDEGGEDLSYYKGFEKEVECYEQCITGLVRCNLRSLQALTHDSCLYTPTAGYASNVFGLDRSNPYSTYKSFISSLTSSKLITQ